MKTASRLIGFSIALLLAFTIYPNSIFSQVHNYSDYQKIREQSFSNSKLRDYAIQITDVIGPRLTGGQGYYNSCNWAVKTLQEIGLSNSRTESWGEFGRGWEIEKFYIAMTKPY